MSTQFRIANETLHLLVAVLILLTSVPMSTSIAAAPAVASDDVGDVVQAETPVREKRLEPGVRLYAVCDPAVAKPGEEVVCTVTVLNEDDGDVSSLKLSARLPQGLSPAGGKGRRWDASVEKLAMGESVALELLLTVSEDTSGPLSYEVEARGRGGVGAKATAIVGVESTESTDERMGVYGGLFEGDDGRIHVRFPPGALKKEARVEARVRRQGIDPGGRAKGKDGGASDRTGTLLRFSLEAEDAATGRRSTGSIHR